ncbi:MAG TPA: MarR family transcriptional regulator [Puia sp.]|nr:MarR family transcriptional regulator [Puia sp.]
MAQPITEEKIRSISELGKKFSDATIFMHEAIAKKAGLTGTDHKYLGLIIQNGPLTAGELSKLTGLTTGAITGLIDRLEKKKLVKRTSDKHDRRKIVIVPNNENATKLLGAVFSDLQNRIVHLLTSLSAGEVQIIEKYLLSTIEIMKEVTKNLQARGHTPISKKQ